MYVYIMTAFKKMRKDCKKNIFYFLKYGYWMKRYVSLLQDDVIL